MSLQTDYIEQTLSFIESAEMRDYLRTRPDCMSRHVCSEIVSCAPAPLERKIPALELIAYQTEFDPEHDYKDPAKLAKEARNALDERYNNLSGAVFLTIQTRRLDTVTDEVGDVIGDWMIFTTFDATVRYLQDYEEIENDPDREGYVWYQIEKWIPGKDGKMERYFEWILNTAGEIWYFQYGEHKFEPEGYDDFFDYLGDSPTHFPVPFKSGDIVLADCRPFAFERPVLILEIGDNRDCCAVRCLFLRKDGKLYTAAFKHNQFLPHPESSHVSGIYRAVRYDGELSGMETPFTVLSAAIKDNPALVEKTLNCFDEDHRIGKDRGIEWVQLKERIGL